jgi:hypothetical protein
MHEIISVEQLRALDRQLWLVSVFNRAPDYQFAIPDLPESSNREASQLMSKYRNACGCFAGHVLMGLTIISFIVHYLASGRGISGFGLKDFAVFIALFVGSALLGKMFGVLWARVRMVQVIRKMTMLANRQALSG